MPGGSLNHLYRDDTPRDRGKSLCGIVEDRSNPLGGEIGSRKTVNCAKCIDLGVAQGIIEPPTGRP